MARVETERDLRLALEKCEQMLARLRQRQASGETRAQHTKRVHENTQQLLSDLAPRARARGHASNEQRPR
jgi:HD superfamily phosphodiesterase